MDKPKDKDLTAKVLKLSELVDYQDGSTVSKILIKGQTGTVTLFAFDQGQILSEHTAPFDALVGIIDGRAEITVSSQAHILTKGQAIIMPANKSHSLKALDRFKMILTMIRS